MQNTNPTLPSVRIEPYPVSAAAGRFQAALDELEELAGTLGELPLEARSHATEHLMRTLQVMSGRLGETTATVYKALFGTAVRNARDHLGKMVSQGQALLERDMPGRTIREVAFDVTGGMHLYTMDKRHYRLRALRLPSGDEAVFATTPHVDARIHHALSFLQPPPIRMATALRPPARPTAPQSSDK